MIFISVINSGALAIAIPIPTANIGIRYSPPKAKYSRCMYAVFTASGVSMADIPRAMASVTVVFVHLRGLL